MSKKINYENKRVGEKVWGFDNPVNICPKCQKKGIPEGAIYIHEIGVLPQVRYCIRKDCKVA